VRLPDAFIGAHVPRTNFDVYAAVGVDGRSRFEVNFGAGVDGFLWKEGNEWAWRIEGHVGRFSQVGTGASGSGSGGGGRDEQLPSYNEARGW